MDGHSSHATMALSDFCIEHQIELISLFPNSIHISQPIDLSFFKPLKQSWKTAVLHWRLANDGDSLKRDDFATVLEAALEDTDTEYPFSANSIDYSKLVENFEENSSSCSSEIVNAKAADSTDLINENSSILEAIENYIGNDTKKLFALSKQKGGDWDGDGKLIHVYGLWLKYQCNSTTTSDLSFEKEKVESSSHQEDDEDKEIYLVDSVSNDVSNDYSNKVSLLDPNDDTAKKNTCDLNDIVTISQTSDNSSNISLVLSDDLVDSHETAVIATCNTMHETIITDENSSATCNLATQSSEKSTETSIMKSPSKRGTTNFNDCIPTAFKKAFYFPNNTSAVRTSKTVKAKERLPAATCEKWREYQRAKLKEKRQEELQKEKRRQQRIVKAEQKKIEFDRKIKIKQKDDKKKDRIKVIKAKLVKLKENEKLLKSKQNEMEQEDYIREFQAIYDETLLLKKEDAVLKEELNQSRKEEATRKKMELEAKKREKN